MKAKRVLFVVLTLLAGCYVFFNDALPPRTPYRLGRLFSGLSIPSDARVRVFEDQYGSGIGEGGDGYTKIVLDIYREDFDALRDECVRSGFQPYTSRVEAGLPSVNYPVTLGNSLYKLMYQDQRMPEADYTIVVLDLTKRQLVILNSVA